MSTFSASSSPVVLDSFTVHASAGTGKTYYLVSKIVQCLLAGARPDTILAITFTRKAAAEMQQRVIERLREFHCADDATLDAKLADYCAKTDPVLRQHARSLYRDVLLSPYRMRISTFHAFCQELLQRFAIDADIPPGSTLSETVHNFLELAWEALMQNAKAGTDPALTEAITLLFDRFSLSSTKSLLHNFIAQRTNWWAWTRQGNRHNAVDFAIACLRDIYQLEDDTAPLQEFIQDSKAHDDMQQFAMLLRKHPVKQNVTFATTIEKGMQQIEKLLAEPATAEAERQKVYQMLKNVFFTGSGSPRKRSSNKTLRNKLGDQTERFLALHDSMCNYFMAYDEKIHCAENFKIICAWYRAGNTMLEFFQKSKRALRSIDFDDLEWLMFHLLTRSRHAQWVQYKIDNRLSHILIDEFQDTNQLQWRYMQPILDELAGNLAERPVNAIIVGDSKQSIYRFRRAEPRLFNSAEAWLQKRFSAQHRELDASYRSSPAIIRFVNDYFSQLDNIDPSFSRHKTQRDDLPGGVYLLQANLPENGKDAAKTTCSHRNPLKHYQQQYL